MEGRSLNTLSVYSVSSTRCFLFATSYTHEDTSVQFGISHIERGDGGGTLPFQCHVNDFLFRLSSSSSAFDVDYFFFKKTGKKVDC